MATQVTSEKLGTLNVYVQGELHGAKAVVLTVHDLGCNYAQYDDFINHPSMAEIKARTAWIHVSIPGQEDQAPDLPVEKHENYKFPSMKLLGEELVCVLDQLKVAQVIGFGEGAGANIIARFAMAHPERVLGITLIHCTGTTAGFMESMKDKLISWKLDHIGMNPTAENYLVLHRFGSFDKCEDSIKQMKTAFKDHLRSGINPKNLRRFVIAFMERSNIVDSIGDIQCPVLLVSGKLASHAHTVNTLEMAMRKKFENKKNVEFLECDDVANVLEEKPEKLAESFQYHLQGIGLVSSIPMKKMGGRPRLPSGSSMEAADLPKSFSPPKANSPLAQCE